MTPHRALLLLAVLASPARAATADDEGAAHFRQVVLPILEASCMECHGPGAERIKGGLLMDGTASLLSGGDSGPAIVLGDPDGSLLVQAVRYADPLLEMPPDGALPPEQVVAIEHWIEAGAPWPRADGPADGETGAARDVETHAANRFFEQEIRPLLAENCFECHGPDAERVKSGLRMTSRDALLLGGDRGPAVVPGAPDESRLARAIGYADTELQMPPSGKLPDADVELLRTWIAMGAPWPDGTDVHVESEGVDVDAGRAWWSFQPVQRPATPVPERTDPVANAVDAFVVARLQEAGLEPAPLASDRELVRRATFGLTGLPPTYEEVAAYVADDAPDKWERLVDELLSRPAYGEHWGRAWLDVVRFAQTNGYEKDSEKPYIWRYRDYVIRAFNEDKPYDRFLTEQLAGDELSEVTNDSLVATGFYQLGTWDAEPDDRVAANFDGWDDVLRTIGEGMLGVTVGCARCHDHKFDPIRQTDYYSMLAFVRNVQPYQEARYALDSATHTPLGFTEQQRKAHDLRKAKVRRDLLKERTRLLDVHGETYVAALLADAPEDVREARATPEDERTPAQEELLRAWPQLFPSENEVRRSLTVAERKELYAIVQEVEGLKRSFEGNLEWAAIASEFDDPRPTNLLVRGNPRSPGPIVRPAFLAVLCADDRATRPSLPPPPDDATTSGRRSALAGWITSSEHPTTARVIANRLWQGHFGRGIVPTPDDFGSTGLPPSHPELLDWLAAELVARDWSLKELHRVILASRTYRQSSRAADPRASEVDPENTLLARQNLRRLTAEAVRDAVLAVSGRLAPEPGGRGFFPELSREAIAGMSKPGEGWETSRERQRSRRAVYAYAKRGMRVPLLEVLDQANPSLPMGKRPVTTTPAQALTLLNSDFMGRQAAALALRVRSESGPDVDRQVARLFELALARPPRDDERGLAVDFVRRDVAAFAGQRTPLRLRPRVPDRLDRTYLGGLPDDRFLDGPRDGWSHRRGLWGNGYNLTDEVDRERPPSTLASAPAFADGSVSARITLEEGCEFASLIVRATPDGDVLAGVEVRLLEETDELVVREHVVVGPGDALGEAAPAATQQLARVPAEVTHEVPIDVVVELSGAELVVRLDGAERARLPVTTTRSGPLGLATWGGALRLEELTIVADGATHVLGPDDPGPPGQRALQALALSVLNLNEFVYVD